MTDISAIRAAATRLRGHARVTPMLTSPFLDAIAGRPVLIKAECLQHTGAFKYRGARNAVAALDPPGVVAFSSGNHAQAVALACREWGVPSVVVMPADAPQLKVENTRALGATVVLYDRDTEDRDAIGARLAADRGYALIKPFDMAEVIAGQGTAGLELAEQAAALGVTRADVLVPCGGGGLTAGMGLALEAVAPGLRVRPVEPEGFDDVTQALATGRVVPNARLSGSICDAIVTPAPGALTWPVLQRLCGPGLAVSEDAVLRAMALAHDRLKLVLEPGGAVALAAALFCPDERRADDEPVIVMASGGNVDRAVMMRALGN